MVRLRRTVRFSVSPRGLRPSDESGVVNGFAGHPPMRGLGRHYEFDVDVLGEADPVTGYFMNIAEIDAATRRAGVPIVERACDDGGEEPPGRVLVRVIDALGGELNGRLTRVRWRLSPTYSVEAEADRMNLVILRQRFEFAAAHRLHAPALSDEENKRVYGKCNHPSGHGHNYHIEPAVEIAPDAAFSLVDLERITEERVVSRYDHRFLNVDAPEFGADGGVTPSVENIARECYRRLAPAIEASGARLRDVTVWETEKTSCTYPG